MCLRVLAKTSFENISQSFSDSFVVEVFECILNIMGNHNFTVMMLVCLHMIFDALDVLVLFSESAM